jgi:hypothetical protein
MAGSNGTLPLHAHSVDWIFGHLSGQRPDSARPASNFISAGFLLGEPPPSAPNVPEERLLQPPQLPPSLEDAPEGRAACAWLQAEQKRLEEYTRAQFAIIQQHHQTLLAKNFQNEQAMALRTQQLNRDMELLATQARALQERANDLAKREAAVAAQTATLAGAQHELRDLERARDAIREEVTTHRTALQELQSLTARLELSLSETSLTERERVLEDKQAELSARQAQMEKRYQDLEKAEAAVTRRAAELDELEFRLEKEFEKQERQLALERREIETLRVRLHVAKQVTDGGG